MTSVLMVTPEYLPSTGGVEQHVRQVSQRLTRAGAEVTVLTTDRTGRLAGEEESGGVRIRRVRARPARRDYYYAPAIAGEIAGAPWDLVHVQSYHTLVAPIAMRAASRAGLPYVVTFHGGGHSSRTRSALRGPQLHALRRLLNRADRLIALAPFEIEHYGRRLGIPADRFALIPNGADLPPPRMGTTTAPEYDGTLVASVGRLERYKGHHRVIRALPAILERRPDVHLWIAGAGPYEPRLRRLARRLGVEEHVEIRAVPPQERTRMAEELAQASLVVLMSEHETQPVAALEALALGRRVLVADRPGLSPLADAGLATAVPLQSGANELAAAMLLELEEPHAGDPPELPTWDACAARLLALYREVLRERSCAS